MERPFLGRGWQFPSQIDADGRVATVSGEAAVEQSVRLILSTAIGERIMRPDFGCGLHARVFSPGSNDMAARIIGDLRKALSTWEHRADLVDLDLRTDANDPARRIVELTVQIKGTNSRFNLVYPFYVDGGAEAADV